MRQVIESFPKQFAFEPEIVNSEKLLKAKKFVVGGMGGSHLAADILKVWKPQLNLYVHYDYGLPAVEEPEKVLFIASSYSGDTEETIDFFEKTIERKFPAAAVGTGGQLIEIAQKHNLPYVRFPDDALQPRLALGYSLKSLLKIIGDSGGLRESERLAQNLKPSDYEEKGKVLAKKLKDTLIAAVYVSRPNLGLALNWRIKINETAKMPAYFHVFPELNHNEIAAFYIYPSGLKNNFYFLILRDKNDHPKVLKRMEILKQIYQEKNLPVAMIDLEGEGLLKIFSSVVLADWFSYYLALERGVDPLSNPMVEKFKKLIS
jgi:glucose/mannose-6-phosphate isomerase